MTVLLTLALLATDWIVSHGPGADFKELQVAIDDARVVDGDTLIIRGTQVGGKQYKPPTTLTKSLTIKGGANNPTIRGTDDDYCDGTALAIDAGPNSTVTIEGLHIEGGNVRNEGYSQPDGIRVVSCGTLIVRRCTVLAGYAGVTQGDWHQFIQEGIDARGADRLILRNCVVRGGKGAYSGGYVGTSATPSDGGAGVRLGGSSALIDDCDVTGGAGGDCDIVMSWSRFPRIWPPDTDGAHGGDGIDVGTCQDVMVLGCAVTGGSRGEYLRSSNPDTWLGLLGFIEGVDGLAIDGDVKHGSG